jgi:hypothetical protein
MFILFGEIKQSVIYAYRMNLFQCMWGLNLSHKIHYELEVDFFQNRFIQKYIYELFSKYYMWEKKT